MRKTLGVCLLVLLLIGTTSAGIIPNGSPTPPPQPASATQEPATGGEIPNLTPDTLTQAALNLLALLPSLL